jgi:hypothetical protein
MRETYLSFKNAFKGDNVPRSAPARFSCAVFAITSEVVPTPLAEGRVAVEDIMFDVAFCVNCLIVIISAQSRLNEFRNFLYKVTFI